MGLFSSLFGGKPDPTKDWPAAIGPAPEFDAATGKLGPLAFGAPLADARFLGKPDEARWHGPRAFHALWARRGLVLEFELTLADHLKRWSVFPV